MVQSEFSILESPVSREQILQNLDMVSNLFDEPAPALSVNLFSLL